MHADDAVRALRRSRHLRDAQGGRIRGEDDRRRAEPVQLRVQFLFDLHLLEDRLDHKLRAVDRLLQRDDPADVGEDRVDLRLGHLAPLHPLLERLRGGPYTPIALAVVSVSFASIFITWSTSPPITIALYRLAIATLIIGATILVRGGVLRRENTLLRIPRRDAAVMVLIGGILATHFALWISSLKVEGQSIASSVVLVTSHPLMVGLLSHYVLRE